MLALSQYESLDEADDDDGGDKSTGDVKSSLVTRMSQIFSLIK